jgi:hypothetical protein
VQQSTAQHSRVVPPRLIGSPVFLLTTHTDDSYLTLPHLAHRYHIVSNGLQCIFQLLTFPNLPSQPLSAISCFPPTQPLLHSLCTPPSTRTIRTSNIALQCQQCDFSRILLCIVNILAVVPVASSDLLGLIGGRVCEGDSGGPGGTTTYLKVRCKLP